MKPSLIAELHRQEALLITGTLQNTIFNSANYSIGATATRQGKA